MKITEILNESCIAVPLEGGDKEAAITGLIDLLDQSGQLSSRDSVLESILTREKTRSTGIGLGLAVPHGKSQGCKSLMMAVGKPDSPLEFDAIDGRPVTLLVLLVSPFDKTGPHIQALAGVSRLWQNETFRREVLSATTAAEIYAAFKNHQD